MKRMNDAMRHFLARPFFWRATHFQIFVDALILVAFIEELLSLPLASPMSTPLRAVPPTGAVHIAESAQSTMSTQQSTSSFTNTILENAEKKTERMKYLQRKLLTLTNKKKKRYVQKELVTLQREFSKLGIDEKNRQRKQQAEATRRENEAAEVAAVAASNDDEEATCTPRRPRNQSSRRKVSLSERLQRLNIQIFVHRLNGKLIPIDVTRSDTISSVKEKVRDKEGVPTHLQFLIFSGKCLEDDSKTLADYKIGRESTVYLHLRLSGGANVSESETDGDDDNAGGESGPAFFEKTPLPSVEEFNTILRLHRRINQFEYNDDDCQMDVLPIYTGVALPQHVNEQQIQTAIAFFNRLVIRNEDWKSNCQQFTNELYYQAHILLMAGEARVYDACKHNYVERVGSKRDLNHRDATHIERTMLSLKHAREDAKSEQVLINRSRNVIYNQGGEPIFVIANWDAYAAFKVLTKTMTHMIESNLTEEDAADDVIVGMTLLLANYNKSGKTRSSISSRMACQKTYAKKCPVTGVDFYLQDGFLALPVISISDSVTGLIEALCSFVFSSNGKCFNQKGESDTSTSSDNASVKRSYVFYLSTTAKGARKQFYKIYRISQLSYGKKLPVSIRPIFRRLLGEFGQLEDDALENIREQHKVDVFQVIFNDLSSTKKPIHRDLCPSGEVDRLATVVAVAYIVAKSDDEESNDEESSAQQPSSSARRQQPSSNKRSRQSRARSSRSSSGSSTSSSRALVCYDPLKQYLSEIKGILDGSRIFPLTNDDTSRTKDAVIVLASIPSEDLVYALLRTFNGQIFVDLLNNRLDEISSESIDEHIQEDVHKMITEIERFTLSELSIGMELFWLQRQLIFGLNRIHSPYDCTLYTHLIEYTSLLRLHRTTNDEDAIYVVHKGQSLHFWWTVLTRHMPNLNTHSSSQNGRSYKTLPIETDEGNAFDAFALEAFKSIDCHPDRLRSAHQQYYTVRESDRMEQLNKSDGNKKRRSRPSR